jgi:endonuclease I
MKSLYAFLTLTGVVTLFCFGSLQAQGFESFNNLNAAANTYTNPADTYTGDEGFVWTHYKSRLISSTNQYSISGITLGFDNSGTGYLESANITGGIGDLQFSWRSYFTGGSASDRQIRVLVNGTEVGLFTLSAMGVVQHETITGINAADGVIRFESVGSRQIAVDDVSWTANSGSGNGGGGDGSGGGGEGGSGTIYQESIFPGLTGNQLLDSLAANYKTSFTLSYNDARDEMFSSIYNVNGYVTCAYTGDVIYVDPQSATPRGDALAFNWNTEHIYPQSKGAGAGHAKKDLHHLLPVRGDVNSSRSNYPFAVLEPAEVVTWWKDDSRQTTIPSGDLGEWSKTKSSPAPAQFGVRDAYQGNVARSVFYFYTMYKAEAEAADPDYFINQIHDLRAYHNTDPADAFEVGVVQEIAAIQGGYVNPFVIDTTLVRRAYFTDYVHNGTVVTPPAPEPEPEPSNLFTGTYNFNNTIDCAIQDNNISETLTNVSFTQLSRTNIDCNAGSGVFNSRSWPVTSSIDQTAYVAFSVTADTGYRLEFDSTHQLDFSIRRSGTGPQNYAFYYSVDGGSFVALTSGTLNNESDTPLSVNMPGIQDAGSVEFRFYGWNAGSSAGTLRFNSLALSGSSDVEGDRLLFSESMGFVSSTTSISNHNSNNGFDNNTFTFIGNADVRSTSSSSGYDGSSGNANIFFGTAGGVDARNITIAGIDTENFDSYRLEFGMNSPSNTGLIIETSTNGSTFSPVSYTFPSSSGWKLVTIENAAIPSAPSVWLRFRKDNGDQYRLDDISLYGVNTTGAAKIAVLDDDMREYPDTPVLAQNYPNPFNPSTQINFTLPSAANVTLEVYNMIGQQVAVLINENRQAGSHTVNFDASRLSSGVYIYRLRTGNFVEVRRMTLIK